MPHSAQAPPICLSQSNFPGMPVARFLALAEAAGAETVDLHPGLSNEPLQTVVAAVAASPLEVVLVSPLPDWYAETGGGRRLPRALPALTAVAAETGGRIGVPSPLVDASASPPEPVAIAAALAMVHTHAAERGVGVAFEPVGRSVMRPGARGAIGALETARALLTAHDLPFALVADSYCVASAGAQLDAPWATADVCVVQLADWAGGDGPRVLPGAGALPLARWLAMAAGPLPPVGLEVFPLDDGGDPACLARALVAHARGLLAAAGLERTAA